MVAHQFSDLVASHMMGPLLPWSSRRVLLREAARMGLAPFETNLIIATVQYRRRGIAPIPPPERRWRFPYYFAAAVVLEAVMLGAAWRFLAG